MVEDYKDGNLAENRPDPESPEVQISDIRGTTDAPEVVTNEDVVTVEDDEDGNSAEIRPVPGSPEVDINDDVINVEDDEDEYGNAGARSPATEGGIEDSGRAEPEFVPAPGVISKKPSQSNKSFFASKSTSSSSGSGGSPKKVIAKRPGGHLRDGNKSGA